MKSNHSFKGVPVLGVPALGVHAASVHAASVHAASVHTVSIPFLLFKVGPILQNVTLELSISKNIMCTVACKTERNKAR